MESGQIFQDFALNVKRVTGPEGDEQRLGVEWMEKFQDSEQALNICYEILKSAIDDDVQLHSVKVIENKTKTTSARLDLNGAKEIYNFLLDFLKRSRNCDVTKQVCIVFATLFIKIKVWDIPLSKKINDIISVIPQPSKGCGDSIDHLYPKEAATIFMRELLVDREKFEDPEYAYFRSKIMHESESMDKIISDFMDVFRDDAFLGEIIQVFRLKARLMPIKNILESKKFLAIIDILQKNDGEINDLIYGCLSFIKTCIKGFEMSSEGEAEKHYRFFSSMARDLRKFVDAGSQQVSENTFFVNNPEPL